MPGLRTKRFEFLLLRDIEDKLVQYLPVKILQALHDTARVAAAERGHEKQRKAIARREQITEVAQSAKLLQPTCKSIANAREQSQLSVGNNCGSNANGVAFTYMHRFNALVYGCVIVHALTHRHCVSDTQRQKFGMLRSFILCHKLVDLMLHDNEKSGAMFKC